VFPQVKARIRVPDRQLNCGTQEKRWRAVNAPHHGALVRAGATFVNGKLVERPDDHHQPETAYGSSSTGGL